MRIFRGEKKYVAECLDLAVVTEADTLDDVTANIRDAIAFAPRKRRFCIPRPRRRSGNRRDNGIGCSCVVPKRLRPLSGRDLLRIFSEFGFVEYSQRGRHLKLRRESASGRQTSTIVSRREVDKGTLQALIDPPC